MPDTAEYLARIREHAEGKDPLELQRRSPAILNELIASASEQQLIFRPSKDKWSVGEILAHLAEDEMATAWRYRQMVEHSGIDLPGFDQDLWARLGNYRVRAPRESLALFQLLREANLEFLQFLTPEQWECYGIHAERGRITVRDLAAHMAGHDANHIEQVRRLLNPAV
ncbi:MAG TPA: DinB family protein [Terriglobales bacterium]|nr:DinB family protein [Terriglobales bacterium]